MHVGTIVSHHYLAHARTLAASLRAHNPGVAFTAVVLGDGAQTGGEPFEVIGEASLGLTDLARRRRAYDEFEYAVSLKPTLLSRLLQRDDLALYLDSDLYVVGALDGLRAALGDGDVGLTPHLLRPLPDDGLQPSAIGILRSGTFNTGFVAVRRGEGAARFLDWWANCLRDGCRDDPPAGYFVDQRWMDYAPGLFPGVRILRDSAWNLGHWNLPGEPLTRAADGWRIAGRPLRAYHFSGFDPLTPARLSKYQNRLTVPPGSPLAELCAEYAAAMLANGYRDVAGGGGNTYYGRSLAQRLRMPLNRWRALARARLDGR